jgi:hypothetical protein
MPATQLGSRSPIIEVKDFCKRAQVLVPCRTWKRNWSGFFKRLGAFSQAQFGFKYSASSSNSGFGSTLCENEPSYRNAKTHRAERSRTIRPAPGNFLTSSLIAFLRRANRCSAGLGFRQIEPPGAPPGGPPRAELLLLLPHMTDDRLSY